MAGGVYLGGEGVYTCRRCFRLLQGAHAYLGCSTQYPVQYRARLGYLGSEEASHRGCIPCTQPCVCNVWCPDLPGNCISRPFQCILAAWMSDISACPCTSCSVWSHLDMQIPSILSASIHICTYQHELALTTSPHIQPRSISADAAHLSLYQPAHLCCISLHIQHSKMRDLFLLALRAGSTHIWAHFHVSGVSMETSLTSCQYPVISYFF